MLASMVGVRGAGEVGSRGRATNAEQKGPPGETTEAAKQEWALGPGLGAGRAEQGGAPRGDGGGAASEAVG